MPDYSKAKIYRISAGDLTYYGSTTQPLCERMASHRRDFRNGKSKSSAIVLQQDPQAKIVLVEDYPCENKEQLNAREQYWIDNNECVNKLKAYTGLTRAEYKKEYNAQYNQDNAEAIKAHKSQYRQDNAEHFKARHTCECGGCYTQQNKGQHERTKKHLEWCETRKVRQGLKKNVV